MNNVRKNELHQLTRRRLLKSALCSGLSLGLAGWAAAQDGPNSSLFSGQMPAVPQPATANGAAALPPPKGWYEVPLPPPKEVRVHDSTANMRYLILPQRPAGTEHLGEEELAALVTRDAMIGVTIVKAPNQTIDL